ncbi:MAG TPA: helix-turn-helix domain-containing protein [Xanthobacteraceae bacterium]
MIQSEPGRIIFNTDTLSERDRFPAFCEEMMRRYAALDIVLRDDDDFRGLIDLQRVGEVGIGHIATTPLRYERTSDLVRDGDDALCFFLCLSGGAFQTQRGDLQSLRKGEGIVCDSGHVGALDVTVDSRFWSVKIPRSRITSLVPHVGPLAGVKLDKDPIALRLLFGYLGAAHDIDVSGGGRAAQLYDEHIIDLFALVLGAEGEARVLAEQRGARALRRRAILSEIERRVGDPTLSAAGIAIRLGITPRYVHLLLEETGRTFANHVLVRRLESAAALLRDPQARDRKIGAIAREVGFTDPSHFNRAFRRYFGETPSTIREAARR